MWEMESAQLEMTRKLLEEGQDRCRAVIRDITHSVADMAFEGVLQRAPNTGRWEGYKDNLFFAAGPQDPEGVSFAIMARPLLRKPQKSDVEVTILYVSEPQGGTVAQMSPMWREVRRLHRWTIDTIPLNPDTAQGVRIVSRTVRLAEADFVRNKREEERPNWEKALAYYGWRKTDDYGANVKKTLQDVKEEKLAFTTEADFVFEAIRVEKGDSEDRLAKPHWRPAILDARDQLAHFAKSDHIVRTFNDPSYQKWKTSPASSIPSVSRADLEALKDFEKYIPLG